MKNNLIIILLFIIASEILIGGLLIRKEITCALIAHEKRSGYHTKMIMDSYTNKRAK